MSSTTGTFSDASILLRVVNPEKPTLSEAAARSILELTFDREAIERLNALAEKNRDGELSDQEQDELDAYQRIGHLLNLLHAKAMLSLDAAKAGQ